MRIALVASQSSSPRQRDAAGQSQRVTSLAEALGRLGHQVTLYAPKSSPAVPAKATLAPGVTVEHRPAGPGEHDGSRRRPSGDEAGLDIPVFSDHLARRWQQDPPDVAHAHFWTSGLAALAGARGLNLPVVQTFHSLGALHADATYRPAGTSRPGRGSGAPRPGASPAHSSRRPGAAGRQQDTGHHLARIRLEVCLARNANAVLATSSEQMTKLAGLGVPRASIRG